MYFSTSILSSPHFRTEILLPLSDVPVDNGKQTSERRGRGTDQRQREQQTHRDRERECLQLLRFQSTVTPADKG